MQESFREHESSRKLKRVKVKRAQKRTREEEVLDGEGTGVFRELLLEPKHSLCLLIKTAPDE